MINKFISFIKQNGLPQPTDNCTIVLAISGGIDSVVMLDLFNEAGYKFVIAHANFQLRGNDSDLDQFFVQKLSQKYNTIFFTKKFDTINYAKQNHLSIQMAARELRLKWFFELCEQYNFPYVATAHHRDDQVETFMINLIRGADFKSLSGIKPVSGKIIHPLLFATKQNIIEYATKKQLTHREDISNQSDKYLRNKIRHNLLPLMEQIYPGAINSIILATQKISDTYEIINSNVEKESKQCISKYNGFTEIDIDKLLKLKPLRLYLHEFIKPYGFNYETTIKIIAAIKKNPGKLFFSTSHQLLIDRNKIIIYTKNNITNNIDEKILINANTSICNHPVKLHFSIIPKTNNFKIPSSNNIACLDYDKLKFPLIIRKWKHGDKFKPLGMIFFKKISDFLIDKKVPLILKKNIYVMCSNENIVWVVGMRIDNRYKLTDTTKNVFFCEIIN